MPQAAKLVSERRSPRPASSPATETSSSSASQCRPRLLKRTCCRSSGVARSRRGNHASGTPIVRPSLNSTHIQSASNRTCFALTEELIPRPLNTRPVCLNHPYQPAQRPRIVAIILCHPNFRPEPEFGLRTAPLNMNMNRLAWRSLVRVKEEPETIFQPYRWHGRILHFETIMPNGKSAPLTLQPSRIHHHITAFLWPKSNIPLDIAVFIPARRRSGRRRWSGPPWSSQWPREGW